MTNTKLQEAKQKAQRIHIDTTQLDHDLLEIIMEAETEEEKQEARNTPDYKQNLAWMEAMEEGDKVAREWQKTLHTAIETGAEQGDAVAKMIREIIEKTAEKTVAKYHGLSDRERSYTIGDATAEIIDQNPDLMR
jgi:predicted  nucleic acid-binding Zn-ribbon protein